MADSSESPPAALSPSAAPRIKRNTACVNCRDSKVKCNASLAPNHPCLRCSKLQLHCVVDKSHKRVSRRSKLEELQQEVRSIKEAVGKSSVPAPASAPFQTRILPPLHTRETPLAPASATVRPLSTQGLLPAVLTPSVTTTPTPRTHVSNGRIAEPRALKSRAFSGEDISFYFDRYFEHFHDYFPIIRSRDPDKIYDSAPILFWTIIIISARRFAKDETVLPFLTDSLPGEVWGAMGNPPLPIGVINALLLLCAWPFTTIRFLRDPSTIFSSIAMSSCFLIGLHTGRGEHPELLNPNFQIRNTDEEATYTWAGFNIISQRVASYTGCPSTGQFFNKTIESILDRTCAVPVPLYFVILLECSRFSNRVSKTTCASLEENRGISHHIVSMFEEEFDNVQRLLFPGISDLDYFTLLSALLDVQSYYFMPVPDVTPDILKRNVLKAYNTAQIVIRQALKLQEETGFLSYAPHFVCRTLLTAAVVTLSVLLSSHMKDVSLQSRQFAVHDAVSAIKMCAIHDGDLPSRASKMIEGYWNLNHLLPPLAVPIKEVTNFSHRLGTSLAFDCIRRWKRDMESNRPAANAAKKPGTPGPLDLGGIHPDTAQLIDWDAFMADFDWSFTPDYLNPT